MNEQTLRNADKSRNVQAVREMVKTDSWRFVVMDSLYHKILKNEVFTDTEFGETFLEHLTVTDWHYDISMQECRDLISLCLCTFSADMQADVQQHLDQEDEFGGATVFDKIHTIAHDQMRHATQENSLRFTIANLVLSMCEILHIALNLPKMLSYMYARADSIESSYDFDL